MKKILTLINASMLLALITGCSKDFVYEHYTYYIPVYATKNEVKANIKSSPAVAIGKPGKIYIKDSWLFLNDVNKGIHIIDFSNPAMPVNRAFINIPGCKDIAVKNNFMYADCYTDLVTIDIADVNNVQLKNYINGVFPKRFYDAGLGTDTSKVILDWRRVDTVIRRRAGGEHEVINLGIGEFSNPNSIASNNSGGNGTGGSMASFALLNNRLYTVDQSSLKVFNTSNAAAPQYIREVSLGTWDIETIYPFKDKLFIGSQSGMYIYSVANPDAPAALGTFSHARQCDPVIADDNTAYVTLRSGSFCTGTSNQLDVVNVQNVMTPYLIKTYPMTNPAGLSKDGNALLICDGLAGLRLFDAADHLNIQPKAAINQMFPYDVITLNGIAIVSAADGIYFVEYSLPNQLRVKGKINVE